MSDVRSPSELSIGEIVATIRHIIAEGDETGVPAPGDGGRTVADNNAVDADRRGAAKPDAGSDDILELTQALNEDGSVRQLAPIGPSLRAMLRGAAAAEPAASAAAAPTEAGVVASPAPAEPSTVPDERRIAEIAARAAAPPPRPVVSETPRAPPPVIGEATAAEIMRSLEAGERPLEEIVRDMLQPLLQAWLDENLPHIVERQVRLELAKTIEKPGF